MGLSTRVNWFKIDLKVMGFIHLRMAEFTWGNGETVL